MNARLRELAFGRPSRALLVLVLVLAAIPRAWHMTADQGVFWPDEIFQTIEQAHRLAFGYGFVPWEFREGARSWVFPGAIAGVLKAASLVGLVDSGVGVVMTGRLVMLTLTLLGVFGAFRIGERIGGLWGGLLGGALCAFFPPLLVYGTRVMSETASGALLVIAAWLVMDPKKATDRAAAMAGAIAGVSIFLRYQNGLFAIVFLLVLCAARAWKTAAMYALAATLVGIAGGLLDWATWGRPFHSFFLYVRFNLIEGKASHWGVSPWNHYLLTLGRSVGPALIVVLLGFALSFRRTRILPIACLVNLAIHSAIPHKEFRFLMPMTPLLLGLAGGGLGYGFEKLAAKRARFASFGAPGLAAFVAAVFVVRTLSMTYGQMGQYNGSVEDGWAPWHTHAGANRALWEAGKREDLCGLGLAPSISIVSTGGFSYLHRDVPIISTAQSEDMGAVNYLIVPRSTPPIPGYKRVTGYMLEVRQGPRTDGHNAGVAPDFDVLLLRREGGCTTPSTWTPHFVDRAEGLEQPRRASPAGSDEREERIALDAIRRPN